MSHPYNEVYLDEIVETQGVLFESLQDDEPQTDGVAFIRAYMASATRAAIDTGDAYLATLGPELLKSYFIETEHYQPQKGEPLRGFAPNWIGQFYARYQWETGIPSARLCEEIGVDWLRAAYPGLHDLDLAVAVEKVAAEARRAGLNIGRARTPCPRSRPVCGDDMLVSSVGSSVRSVADGEGLAL